MVYTQQRIHPWKWDAQNSLGFRDRNGSSNLGQTTTHNDKKKIVDFAVLADHRVKLKESEKREKYLAKELKKLWNIKLTVIPIVIVALGTIIKVLVQGLEDLDIKIPVVTIQTTAEYWEASRTLDWLLCLMAYQPL